MVCRRDNIGHGIYAELCVSLECVFSPLVTVWSRYGKVLGSIYSLSSLCVIISSNVQNLYVRRISKYEFQFR
jgi:hypothetical protein